MSNKQLGILALIGAPFLYLGFILEQQYKILANSWFTGVWGLFYISGWICSMLVLQRLGATGNSWFGKVISKVILGTLLLANASNLYQLFLSDSKTTLFWILDAFWPISNLLMLVTGITIIVANRLTGWQRFVPLVVGLWFPFAMSTRIIPGNLLPNNVVGLYSAIAWSLLAIVALTAKPKKENSRKISATPPKLVNN